MKRRLRRVAPWLAGGVLLLGAARLVQRFPWQDALHSALDADPLLLLAALGINLVSLAAKGWAWQLILRPVQRISWATAQAATLAGAAVTDLATSVVGEAARIQVAASRGGLAWSRGVASVVYLRMVEGVGLAVFLLAAAPALPLAASWRRAEAAAVVVVVATLLLLSRRLAIGRLLPRGIRSAIAPLASVAELRRLPGPLALAAVNWLAQWATYALVLAASGVHPARLAGLVALLAVNLAGLVPVTPGNVGVFQAAVVLGLMPMGIEADRAVLAGIALQVIQIPPVLALAAMVFGFDGLKQLRAAPQGTAAGQGTVEAEPGLPRVEPGSEVSQA